MAGQDGKPGRGIEKLDEAALASVSAGVSNLPNINIPGLPGPGTTPPGDGSPSQFMIPVFLLPPQFQHLYLPGQQEETSGAPGSGQQSASPGGGWSSEHEDRNFLAGQEGRMGGHDLNTVNLDSFTAREVELLQARITETLNSPSWEQHKHDPVYQKALAEAQEWLRERIGQVGAEGSDNLSGDNRNDTLRGNAGDDTLQGGGGGDRIGGGAGADLLRGDWADDRQEGGADTLDGGIGDAASDTAFGGGGDDTYIWRAGDGSDQFHGGGGNDTLVIGKVGPNQLLSSISLDGGLWLHSTDNRTFTIMNAQNQPVTEASGTLRIGDEVLTFTGVGRIVLP